MKKILIIMLCCIGFYADAYAYEKGVSKELAAFRAQNILDISYNLTFDIPADVKGNVTGAITVDFYLNRKTEVVLDFQGKFSGACLVNGKKRVAKMENDHIVIPEKMTKKGLNRIEMNFVSLDNALNRNADYLYAQFAPGQAQSCFPCFDQPDIRAKFTTRLNVPEGWKTLVNTGKGATSTALYSFTAGKFEEQTAQRGDYNIHVFYRENSPEKLKQLPTIIDETAKALAWTESYTGVGYPFKEVGIVIQPDRQLTHISHLGVMQLPGRYMFLDNNPLQEESLQRTRLIAQETARQWFGHTVILEKPEDTWTKEVFSNFIAYKFMRSQLNKTDQGLDYLRTYHNRAMAFDRTEGAHPIAPKSENPTSAKVPYDDIIHAKAPVMMRTLEEIVGAKELQESMQAFLTDYHFKSASWDDFINVLERQTSMAGVRQFSDVWVKQKGMPVIRTTYQDGQLVVTQTDPAGRGLFWRQKFEIRLIYDLDRSRTVTVDMTQPTVSVKIGQRPSCIIPNYDGRGYGRFILDDDYIQKLPQRLIVTRSDLHRYALLQTLHDNYLMGNIPASYFGELYRNMMKETNPLIMQTTIDHMFKIAFDRNYSERQTLEQCIMDLLPENKRAECRKAIIRKMSANATAPEILTQIEKIWDAQNDPLFDEHDYMEMAYRLALTHPGQWQMIIDKQRGKLKSDQLREEFDYVSRACNPDEQVQRNLFNDIIKPENRQHDSWALHALQLLNADIREPQNNVYVAAGLNSLEMLQETSDGAFVNNWLNILLQNHKSQEAQQSVEDFLKKNPTYQEDLRNQIFAASWLMRNIKPSEPPKPAKAKPQRAQKSSKKK